MIPRHIRASVKSRIHTPISNCPACRPTPTVASSSSRLRSISTSPSPSHPQTAESIQDPSISSHHPAYISKSANRHNDRIYPLNPFSSSDHSPRSPLSLLYATSPTILPTPLPKDSLNLTSATYSRREDAEAYATKSSQNTQFRNYMDSNISEQMAILSACVNTGKMERVKKIWAQIRGRIEYLSGTAYSRATNPASDISLWDVAPLKLHNDIIRGFFRNALDSLQGGGGHRETDMHVQDAWNWFEMLRTDPAVSREGPDKLTFAIMVKGLVLSNLTHDPEERLTPTRSLISLLSYLRSSPTLPAVLCDPIFEFPDYMGPLTSREALNKIEHLVETEIEAGQFRADEEDVVRSMLKETKAKLDKDEEAIGKLQEMVDKATTHPEVMQELEPVYRETGDVPLKLEMLRTNLVNLKSDKKALLDLYARQRQIEESSFESARELFIHEQEEMQKLGLTLESSMKRHDLHSMIWNWTLEMEKEIARDIKKFEMSDGEEGQAAAADDNMKPFVRLISPIKMAFITIVEILRASTSGNGGIVEGVKTPRAVMAIGRAVEIEHHVELLKGSGPRAEMYERLLELSSPTAAANIAGLASTPAEKGGAAAAISRMWRNEMKLREEEGDLSFRPAWTHTIKAKVGSYLLTKVLGSAKMERTTTLDNGEIYSEVQSAFFHSYQYSRGHRNGVIKLNPALAERLDKDPLTATLHPRYLPMLVKPKPWIGPRSGGYLVHDTCMMRAKDTIEQMTYLESAHKAGRLETFFAALDVLGAVPWKINKGVLEVVSELWNKGEEVADIPIKDPFNNIADPIKPEDYDTNPRSRADYKIAMRRVHKEKAQAHSTRCDTNYKLEIARAFLDEDRFYFPHSVDFRGRAYPIPPNLSHIGDDLCRGLLTFAEAKPLGASGLRWLKIHLANVCGYDKASLDEREAYTMEHLDDVFDSAENPINGRRWWLKSDDPWQTLAACKEVAAALRSPVPEEFESRLPVHQDGTCNGLQHYAALGGDEEGARQVNLLGGDRPSDVYSGVCKMVNEKIEEDFEKGVSEAVILRGKVTRKVVKQTVMTTVYGVTFIGAKKQLERQLRDRGDIPEAEIYQAGLYLGRLVLNSIGSLFQGATAIQVWFTNAAKVIAKSIPESRIQAARLPDLYGRQKGGRRTTAAILAAERGAESPSEDAEFEDEEGGEASQDEGGLSKPSSLIRTGNSPSKTPSRIPREQMTSVIWTTPLGLPVVQPYRKDKKKQASFFSLSRPHPISDRVLIRLTPITQVKTAFQTVFITDPQAPAEVDPRAQSSAFPPNFIHSLDATHMLMTALASKDRFTFAAVHDSYWTHACDVEELSSTLRDQFIELHSHDILGELRNEILERYRHHMVPLTRINDNLRTYLGTDKRPFAVVKRRPLPSGPAPLARLVSAERRAHAHSKKMGRKVSKRPDEEVPQTGMVDPSIPDALQKMMQGLTPLEVAEKLASDPAIKVFTPAANRAICDENDSSGDAYSDIDSAAAAAEDAASMEGENPEAEGSMPLPSVEAGKADEESADSDFSAAPGKAAFSSTAGAFFAPLTSLIPPVPPRGKFDLENVRSSTYFFS